MIFGAERLVVPDHADHAHEIDDALELLLGADRQLDGDRPGARADRLMSSRHWKKSAPILSILLAEHDARNACSGRPGARPSRSAARRPGWSRARRRRRRARASERSTSMVKSTWPGVSMMLSRLSFQNAVVAADVMVMPRSCSCSIQSMVAAPSCTSPILWLLPV